MQVAKCFLIWIIPILISTELKSQQCGFEHHSAILVHAIHAQAKEIIHGLKMYLSFENGMPITSMGATSYDNKTSQLCIDSFLFWENKSQSIIPTYCYDTRLYRRTFPNAGDHYICVVPSYNGKNDLSKFSFDTKSSQTKYHHTGLQGNILDDQFFINIIIEDIDGDKNGGEFARQQIRIPIGAVTDICSNHLDKDYDQFQYKDKLNPIQIYLEPNNKNYKAEIDHKAFDTYFASRYEVKENSPFENENLISRVLERVELYDEKTGNLLQTISNPAYINHPKTWREGNMEFENFYNDDQITKLGFRIPSTLQGREKNAKHCYSYYKYNPLIKLYEADTLLNSKQETRFNTASKIMYATDWVDSTRFLIEYTFELKNKTWQLIKTQKHEKTEAVKPMSQNKMAICYFKKANLTLPIQYFRDGAKTLIIQDTLWIANYGNESAKIKIKNGTNFKVPNSISPNQILPIVYYRELSTNTFSNSRSPFESIVDGLTITYNENELSAGVEYLLINHQAEVKTQADQSIQFIIPHQLDEYFSVSSFPNLYLKEYGKYSSIDSSRIGEWTIIDSSQPSPINRIQYNKVFRVQLANSDINQSHIEIEYIENDVVKRRVAKHINGKIILHSNDHKLLLITENLKADYKLDFNKLQQEDGVTLYLLKENQNFYYWGQVKIPIYIEHQQYAIRWNYNSKGLSSYNILDIENAQKEYLKPLLNQFSNLKYYDIDTSTNAFKRRNNDNFYVLDFSKCNIDEKKSIFSILEKDTNILSVNILMNNSSQHFCDNHIYFIQNTLTKFDSTMVKKGIMNGFTFQNMQTSASTYNYYFKYKSKIVNEDFFADFNSFCESNLLQPISLNIYANHQPEVPEENLNFKNMKR